MAAAGLQQKLLPPGVSECNQCGSPRHTITQFCAECKLFLCAACVTTDTHHGHTFSPYGSSGLGTHGAIWPPPPPALPKEAQKQQKLQRKQKASQQRKQKAKQQQQKKEPAGAAAAGEENDKTKEKVVEEEEEEDDGWIPPPPPSSDNVKATAAVAAAAAASKNPGKRVSVLAQAAAPPPAAPKGGSSGWLHLRPGRTPFDRESGVMAYLGRNASTNAANAFKNPAKARKLVKISCSGVGKGSDTSSFVDVNVHAGVAPAAGGLKQMIIEDNENGWVAVQLLKHRLRPTHYALRHVLPVDAKDAMRHWRFEASADGRKWVCMRRHNNDSTLGSKLGESCWHFAVPKKDRHLSYSLFRVRITGFNASGVSHAMHLASIELFGFIKPGATLKASTKITAPTAALGKQKRLSLVVNSLRPRDARALMDRRNTKEPVNQISPARGCGVRGGSRGAGEDLAPVDENTPLAEDRVDETKKAKRVTTNKNEVGTVAVRWPPEASTDEEFEARRGRVPVPEPMQAHYRAPTPHPRKPGAIAQAQKDAVASAEADEKTNSASSGAASKKKGGSSAAFKPRRPKKKGGNTTGETVSSPISINVASIKRKVSDVGTTPSQPIVKTATALYAFKKTDDTSKQLSFPSGAILTILSEDDPGQGWWTARFHGRVGIVPASYLKLSKTVKKRSSVLSSNGSKGSNNSSGSGAGTTNSLSGAMSGWKKYTDEKSGRDYWFNKATQETTWKDPAKAAAARAAAVKAGVAKASLGKIKKAAAGSDTSGPPSTGVNGEDMLNTRCLVVHDPQWAEVSESEWRHSQTGQVLTENPHRWNEYVEESTGRHYWYNSATAITTWDNPSTEIPQPLCPEDAQRFMPSQLAEGQTERTSIDENGILYWLGTEQGQTTKYRNPAATKGGLVTVQSTPISTDSKPPSAMIGRSLVRAVLEDREENWFIINFAQHVVRPSHYLLRHYKSKDSHALRYWVLEGGNSHDDNWTVLRQHFDDDSLNKAGAIHLWALGDDAVMARPSAGPIIDWFSRFRVRMTGPNSNASKKARFLCCSGFELYGDVREAQRSWETPSAEADSDAYERGGSNMDAVFSLPFHFAHDFDTNGILYFIGTHQGTVPWMNPSDTRTVTLASTPLEYDSNSLACFIGRTPTRGVLVDEPGNWFSVTFENGLEVMPTAYTLRHYSSKDSHALRNWVLEASTDAQDGSVDEEDMTWTVLREHSNDSTLASKGQSHTWLLHAGDYTAGDSGDDAKAAETSVAEKQPIRTFYRSFRVRMTGPNSSSSAHFFCCSGFEIYGTLRGPIAWMMSEAGAEAHYNDYMSGGDGGFYDYPLMFVMETATSGDVPEIASVLKKKIVCDIVVGKESVRLAPESLVPKPPLSHAQIKLQLAKKPTKGILKKREGQVSGHHNNVHFSRNDEQPDQLVRLIDREFVTYPNTMKRPCPMNLRDNYE